MKLAWAAAIGLWLAGVASAQAPSPDASREIEYLFGRLAQSSCEFNRNGSWYAPKQAVGHLRKKYNYLLKRDGVPTAESFVKHAATQSSLSGKPYLVRCGTHATVTSKSWFLAELARYRDSEHAGR